MNIDKILIKFMNIGTEMYDKSFYCYNFIKELNEWNYIVFYKNLYDKCECEEYVRL